MALPKEPRQKMINLMYLVLTALLALNVSAEILNAFKAATIVTKKHPPPITPANLIKFDLRGSDSLLRFINISVYKNNTKIAPI